MNLKSRKNILDKPFTLEESENIQKINDELIEKNRELLQVISFQKTTIEKLEKSLSNS